MDIFNKIVSTNNSETYIIAEIGSNFNGSLELAKKSIKSAADCGANAVKFQTFKADEFIADKDLTYTYFDNAGNKITESQYDMFKRLELKNEWHYKLAQYSNSLGVDFFSSAADTNAVDLLIDLKVPFIKFASEDLINVNLLEYAAKKNYPVILSTGMANEFEISNAVNIFSRHDSSKIILLHCVSQYPTKLENAALNRISALKEKYDYIVGYSDHTEGWLAPVLAVAIGAKVIEKHFTIDKNLEGPDHKMSSNPTEFSEMVRMIRMTEKTTGIKTLNYQSVEQNARTEFRRSIVAKENLKKGTVLTENMLAYKRPGNGLKPYEKNLILNKKLNTDIEKNQQIFLNSVIH